MDYLRQSLSREALLGLYSDEKRGKYVCRAVLQRLPETSQQIVVRLSCTGGEFSIAMIRVWLKGFSLEGRASTPMAKLLTKQLNELYHWAIVTEKQGVSNTTDNIGDGSPGASDSDNALLKLTPEFFKGLKDSLHSMDASPWIALKPDQIEHLEKEANKENHNK